LCTRYRRQAIHPIFLDETQLRSMRAALSITVIAGVLAACGAEVCASAQDADEPIGGILIGAAVVTPARAQRECLELPLVQEDERLGPHGDTLLDSRCTVTAFEGAAGAPTAWKIARYKRVLTFSPENPAQIGNDTIIQDEDVLFEVREPNQLRPIWHARFESDAHGVYRSVTPEIAASQSTTVLLSVMSCVNGTGGCSQDFVIRHRDGRWAPVTQRWLEELPNGFFGRIRHGVRIEPSTLRAEAGFYGDADPNCCPSEILVADLVLRNDALVLRAAPRIKLQP
jgi:hypothetical protein